MNVYRNQSTRTWLAVLAILAVVVVEVLKQNGIEVSEDFLLSIQGVLGSLGAMDTFRPLGIRDTAAAPPEQPDQPVREARGTTTLGLVTILAAIGLVIPLAMAGCAPKYALTNIALFDVQTQWLSARNEENILLLKEAGTAARNYGDLAACETYWDQALVLQHGVSYRYAMMRHLIQLEPDPGEPQDIPTVTDQCMVEESP